MKIEDITTEWAADTELLNDPTEISRSLLSIPKLHHKYYRYFLNEKLVHMKYVAEYNILKVEKHEFFIQGPSKETEALGWKYPASGKVLKSDINIYMEGDRQIIDATLKAGMQNAKVDYIKSILENLKYRGHDLKAALDDIKFKNGS